MAHSACEARGAREPAHVCRRDGLRVYPRAGRTRRSRAGHRGARNRRCRRNEKMAGGCKSARGPWTVCRSAVMGCIGDGCHFPYRAAAGAACRFRDRSSRSVAAYRRIVTLGTGRTFVRKVRVRRSRCARVRWVRPQQGDHPSSAAAADRAVLQRPVSRARWQSTRFPGCTGRTAAATHLAAARYPQRGCTHCDLRGCAARVVTERGSVHRATVAILCPVGVRGPALCGLLARHHRLCREQEQAQRCERHCAVACLDSIYPDCSCKCSRGCGDGVSDALQGGLSGGCSRD